MEGVPETPFPGDRTRAPAEGQADAVWCGEVHMKQQKEPTPSTAPVGGRGFQGLRVRVEKRCGAARCT